MLSNKFIHKYLRIAKFIGEDNNPCLSRSIGVVVVNPHQNRIVGTGWNGPPKGTPHCDTKEYLTEAFWPQLTEKEKEIAGDEKTFINQNTGCGTCPRRLVGAKSGDRLNLCSCQHAERNAITNSAESLKDCWMFCWCGIPCWDCSGAIINAGIDRIYCVDTGPLDYSLKSRWLLESANIPYHIINPEEVLNAD